MGYITNINASSRSKDFPANEIFSSYAKEQKEERITCLWAGMLCYVLLREFAGEPGLIGLANESVQTAPSMDWADGRKCAGLGIVLRSR